MNDSSNPLQPVIPPDDGFADAARAAGSRLIKGDLLKFADWHWYRGRESAHVADGTRFVATATQAAWVFWQGGQPVRYIVRQPGEDLPERRELGNMDSALWERGPGGDSKDPWSLTDYVTLLVPDRSAEMLTFTTSSWGGRTCVEELSSAVFRVRTVRPGAVPVVELRSAEWPTKYGKKSRPVLRIVDWVAGAAIEGAGETSPSFLPANDPPTPPAEPQMSRRRRSAGEPKTIEGEKKGDMF